MSLTIATNIASINSQRQLQSTQTRLDSTMTRLASGLRINSAADDAAGLAISEKLRSQIRTLSQAQRNANDGISMAQIADGALGEMSNILMRMRELGVQAANGTLDSTERGFLDIEYQQLVSEVNRIASITDFNGTKLLDGSASAGMTLQVGTGSTLNDRITMSITNSDASALALTGTSITSMGFARGAMSILDTAIHTISATRARIGAVQNRLQVTINNISTARENLSAANSRIRDADIANETAELTKNQILTQAGVSVLAQANNMPQMALSLIRGGG